MPACEKEWAAVVERHNLQPLTLEKLVGASFQYADFVFAHGKEGPLPPAIVSTVKARQAGFAGLVLMGLRFETLVEEAYEAWHDPNLAPDVPGSPDVPVPTTT